MAAFPAAVAVSNDPERLDQMPMLFQRTAMSLFIAAAVLALLVVPIRRMMKESSASGSH